MRAATMNAVALALLAMMAGDAAQAQSLAGRVRAVGTGVAELHYTSRPGVCGDGRRYFSIGRHSYYGEWSGGDRDPRNCQPGPARVRLRVEGGSVTDVRVAVGPAVPHEERATDLGEVASAEAASFFLSLADSSSRRVGHGAITAAVLADSVSVWQRLLAIAADTGDVARATRRDAMFWVGRFATAKVMGYGEDITEIDGSDDRDDTRGDAVFALSQMHGRQGIDPLFQIARSHRDPTVRGKAIFWISQSNDPRAVTVLREILRGGAG
jgi:hypothetical protein